MGHYIMRLPADMPELTYDGLSAYLDKKGRRRATIGTTVEVSRNPSSEVAAYIDLRLYALDIVRIYRDCVTFPVTHDSRQSTRQWLEKVVRDNGIGTTVYRVRRRKSDGPGWGGVLVIDGDRERPVEGHTYSVNLKRAGHYHDPQGKYDYCDDPACPRANPGRGPWRMVTVESGIRFGEDLRRTGHPFRFTHIRPSGGTDEH